MSVLQQVSERDAFAELSRFRTAFYGCLSARADAFFELTAALLCADGPTRTPVELSLLAEHQRGYGPLYGALNHGRLDVDRLRDLMVSMPLPRFDGRVVLTVDVSPWLRAVRTRPPRAARVRRALASYSARIAIRARSTLVPGG